MAELERYPKEDWQYEVANGDTKLGFEAWQAACVERDALLEPEIMFFEGIVNNYYCIIVADSFERVQGEIFNLSEDRPGEHWTFTNPHKTHDGKWCAQGRKR